jgi:hypothetical protein
MKRVLIAGLAAAGMFLAAQVVNAAPVDGITKPQPAANQAPVTQVKWGGGRGMGGGGRGIGGGRFMGRSMGAHRYYGGRSHIYSGGARRYAYGGGYGRHHRGPRFRSLYYGAPFVGYGAYYGSGYYGGGGCSWLRRRAEATGSSYWWARYEDCLDSY